MIKEGEREEHNRRERRERGRRNHPALLAKKKQEKEKEKEGVCIIYRTALPKWTREKLQSSDLGFYFKAPDQGWFILLDQRAEL